MKLITLSTYYSYFTPGWEAGAQYMSWKGPNGFRYDAVSLGHPNEHNPWLEKESWPHIIAYLKEHRVPVAALHSPIEPDFDLGTPDEETRRRTIERHLLASQFAHLLAEEGLAPAGELVQVVHLTEQRQILPNELKERSRIASQSWREMVEMVYSNYPGVVLALENLPGNQPREELTRLVVEQLGEMVNLCLDTGHLRLDPDREKKLSLYAPLSIATHLQDNGGDSDSHHLARLEDDWIKHCLSALKEGERFRLVIQEHRGDRASVEESLAEASKVKEFLSR